MWVINKAKFKKIPFPKCRAGPALFGIPVGDSCVCSGEAARAGRPLSGVRGPIRRSV